MQEQNKKIAKNTIYLYLRTFLSIIVTLYTSRVLLEMLGVEDYGIYNLVAGIIALLAVLRTFLTGSIQRFLNIEIGKGEKSKEFKILNISIVINIALIIIFLIISETIGLWFVVYQLNIPLGKEMITQWVYHFAVITSCVTMLTTPYNAYIIAHERMGFFALITIFDVISKLGITLALTCFDNRLIVYSFLLLLMYVGIYFWDFLYCKRKIGLSKFEWYSPKENKEYGQIISFSIWTVAGNGACVMRDQGLSILFNLFHGVILNAAMGVTSQVSNVYTTLFSNVQTAFLPQIVQTSDNEKSRFNILLQYSCLSSFLMMSVVCLPMIVNAEFILHKWLGNNVPDFSIVFVQIVMVKTLFVSISQALYTSLVAVGKIKLMQICYIVLSILTIVGCYALLALGFNPSWALWLTVVMDATVLVMRINFIDKLAGVQAKLVIKWIWKPFLLIFCVFVPLSFVGASLTQNWKTFLWTSLVLLLSCILIALLSLEKNIRELLIKSVLKKTRFGFIGGKQ